MGEFDSRRSRPFRPSVDGGGIPRKTVDGIVSLFTKKSGDERAAKEQNTILGSEYFIKEENEWRLNLSELQWHALEEDDQDHVRYELERRTDIDWPFWIPREDVYGPIRSRRGRMDDAFGSFGGLSSDLSGDELRELRDMSFPPTDPAAGADK